MTMFCATGCQRALSLSIPLVNLGDCPPLPMEKLVKALQTAPGRRPSRPTCVVYHVGHHGLLRREPQFDLAMLLDPDICGGRTLTLEPGLRRAWYGGSGGRRSAASGYAAADETHARSFVAFSQRKMLTRQILVPGLSPPSSTVTSGEQLDGDQAAAALTRLHRFESRRASSVQAGSLSLALSWTTPHVEPLITYHPGGGCCAASLACTRVEKLDPHVFACLHALLAALHPVHLGDISGRTPMSNLLLNHLVAQRSLLVPRIN